MASDFAAAEVQKAAESCMSFLLFELHGWVKRSATQPKTIDSEVPEMRFHYNRIKSAAVQLLSADVILILF